MQLRAARRSRMGALILVAMVAGLAGGGARGAFPGAAGKIAYTSTRLGGEQVFVASSDGSNETQLTGTVGAEGSVNAHPAWSPDGTKVVFDSNRNGGQEIYVMNADGTGQTRLTNNSSSDEWAGFSPDGKKICFSSNRDGDYEIFTMNADGSGQKQITSNTVTDSRCSWSPAGTRIAYESESDVWTVRTDGSGPMNLTVTNEGFDGRPSWSPDGTQIVFDSVRQGASSIYRMTAGGAEQTDLTLGATDINPDLSPDSQQLAFERGSEAAQLVVASSDGAGQHQITPNLGSNTDAAWQPVRGPIVDNPNCAITQDHSIDGVTTSSIEFVNESGVALKVYWLDYDGNRVLYNALNPGESYVQSTWLTHPWVGLDSDGNCYGFTVSDTDSKTYVFHPFGVSPPQTTPGNGQIVYLHSTSLADPNHDLYTVQPGPNTINPFITDPATTDQLAAVDPGGSCVVYSKKPVAAADSAFELWLDCPNIVRRLTDNGVLDDAASWSPEGTTLAFVSRRDGVDGIYLMDMRTFAVTKLYQGADVAGAPSFSPDSRRVAFHICGSPGCHIFTIGVDGSGLTQITSGAAGDTDPDWGPDGRIVFVRALDSFSHQLVVVNPDGSGAVQITSNGAYNADPSWSPDGHLIAFATTAFGNSEFDLARIGDDGSGITQIVAGGRNGFPDWAATPSFASPITNAVLRGSITVRIGPVDLPVASAHFSYVGAGGTKDLGTDSEPPFTAAFDTTTVADGPGRLVVDTGGLVLTNSIPVTVDNIAPDTTIAGTPADGASTTSSIANYSFSSDDPSATFECALDTQDFGGCPRRNAVFILGLDPGSHTFRVRAVDSAGTVDPTPATRTWTVLAPPAQNTAGKTSIASLTNAGAGVNGSSAFPSISDDGTIVGFESNADNITPAGSGGILQAYVRDRGHGTSLLLSGLDNFDGGINLGNANSGYVQVSGDGTRVAFQSLANTLGCINDGATCVPDNSTWHVYVRTLAGGQNALALADASASLANGSSEHPALSGDGTLVAFDSAATNLGATDTNGARDIYLRTMQTGAISRVSVATVTGGEANGASTYPAISGNGRYVAFVSDASNLVPNDVNGLSDVFVRDVQTGATTLVSVSTDGTQGNGESGTALAPSISADGRYVVFHSRATNFAPGVLAGTEHVYLRDLVAGTTEPIDVSSTEARADAQSTTASVSDDGRYVTFTSAAANLSPLVTTHTGHVYRRDRQLGTTNVVDLNPAGLAGNGTSQNGQFGTAQSADGRYAVFSSTASDLLGPGKDSNESGDVFVRDFNAVAVVTGVTANLTTGSPSTEAGARDLPIADFPLSVLRPPAQGTAAAQAPIDNFPIDNFPIDNFPIDNFPIDNFPIDNFPFDAPSAAPVLDAVPLSTIGIRYPGGWPAVLKGSQYDGVPPQGVSLGQLARANPKSPALDPASTAPKLTFDQLDFAGSRLRHLGLEALAVGAVPLSAINPLGGGDALTDWCKALNGPPISCTPANTTTTIGSQTVLGAALLGAPIDNFPIDNFPIDNFPIDNFPIDNMPIDNFPIDNMPLSVSPIDNFPIDNFNLTASGFGALRLTPMLQANSPLGRIPVASLVSPNAVLTATTEPTLAAAFAAGHVRPTATLADLRGNLGGFTLGDLLFYGSPPKTVHDLLAGLPTGTGFTFSDLLALFITRTGVEWETLSSDTLASFGTNGRLAWHAGFRLEGQGGAAGTTTISVTLPAGWRYDATAGARLVQGETSTPVGAPAVSNGGRTLAWDVSGLSLATDYSIDFFAFPGSTLGPASGTEHVEAASPGGPVQADDAAPITVRQVFEPNDDPATAPIIQRNTEVDMSYIDAPGDVDFYRIPAPPAGDRLTVRMTNLPADYDLTLYAPATAPLTSPGAAGVPLQDPPLPDTGIDMTNTGAQLVPAGLQDVQTVNLPIAGQSIFRGTDPEDVTAISPGGSGFFVLEVSGYSGASSPRPYTLRATSHSPAPLGQCDRRQFPFAGQGTAGSAALNIPADVNTLFLVNQKRLGDTYGTAGAADVMAALTGLAGQRTLGVSGAVIPVEAYGNNASLYSAWDDDPCSPERANAVATALAATVDSIRASRPTLKYLVLVGGDDQIPFFRVPDLTLIANERSEAATFTANQYFGAFVRENLLSDDPYLDTDPIQSGTRQIFVPDLAGGRLVETPGQIVGQISQFTQSGGILLRQTAFSSGYDFASDGTQVASDNLASTIGAANTRTLINNTWNRAGFLAALFPTGGASSIDQLNGHYDHYQALPAAGNTTTDSSDLVTTADIDAHPLALARRSIFSIGCHAGLAVSNVIVGETSPIRRDWAEAYADQRATYAANTGYGLGATDAVAYSEELMARFAGHFDGSLSIGQAFAQAKADYFLDRVAFSAYEQKTTLEATLYGLPFYGIGVAPPAVGSTPPAPTIPPGPVPGASSSTSPAQSPIVNDPVSGLRSAEFSATPVFTRRAGAFGDFWTNAGQVATAMYRPIVSRLALPATKAGERAHSAFIESLTSTDDSPWNPALLMPTEDKTALSPEPSFSDIGWPSAIPVMATTKTAVGLQSQLNLATSQYFTDDTPGTVGATVMRRWTGIGGRVFYNSSTSYAKPTILTSAATQFGSNIGFSVSVCDAVRVFILFDDLGVAGTTKSWTGVNLVKDTSPGSCRWTGGAPIVGPNVQYIVQACNADGNCALSTNKAHYYQAQQQPPPPGGGITITLTGTAVPGQAGFFSGPVSVEVSPLDGSQVRLDGQLRTSVPFTVTTDGLHVVSVDTATAHAERAFVIDATNPSVIITTPPVGAVYTLGQVVKADFRCLDSGSGIASCTGTVANGASIPTSTVGTNTFTVTARDAAGHTSSLSRTYTVIWDFSGFFSPVDNPPVINVVVAGSAVPVKFSLHGNQGLAIFEDGYPRTEIQSCSSTAPLDGIDQTVTAGGSSLQYDAASDRYTYIWKTEKSWPKGQCRQLILKLRDGTFHRANFMFK